MENFEIDVKNNSKMIEILEFSRENFIPTLLSSSAKFLYDIVKQQSPVKVLEVGTGIGYSTLIMLLAGAKHITTVEIDENRYNKSKQNIKEFGFEDRVTSILGEATSVIEKLKNQNEVYDFVFIDGPKGQYLKQFNMLDSMIKKSGVLVFDDVLYMYATVKENNVAHKHRAMITKLREFVKQMLTNSNYNVEFINIDEGVIVATKK